MQSCVAVDRITAVMLCWPRGITASVMLSALLEAGVWCDQKVIFDAGLSRVQVSR